MKINTHISGCFYVLGHSFSQPVIRPVPCKGVVVVKAACAQATCILRTPCDLLCVHSPMKVVGTVQTLLWDNDPSLLAANCASLTVRDKVLLSTLYSRTGEEIVKVTYPGVTVDFC